MSIFGDFLSPGSQPFGSTINNEHGTFSNIADAISGSNPGRGPGVYFDKGGGVHTTQAEAAAADYAAAARGHY